MLHMHDVLRVRKNAIIGFRALLIVLVACMISEHKMGAVSEAVPAETAQAKPTDQQKQLVWAEPQYIAANKRFMEDLYRGITGFIKLSDEERASIESDSTGRRYTKKTSTYGEIPYDSLQIILDNEHIGPNAVFYDLGSGAGKVAIGAFLNTPAKKVVGIELSPSRCAAADAMFKKFKQTNEYQVRRKNGKMRRSIELRKGDFLKANLDDATIIYMCSTCFPPELLTKLVEKFEKINKLGLRVITLKELPDHEQHGFRFERCYSLPMSWSKPGKKSNVFVYSYAGKIFN